MKSSLTSKPKSVFLKTIVLLIFLFNASINATSQMLTGIITNEEGQPLNGASVVIKGTGTQTISTETGAFSILPATPLTNKDSIYISYTGYKPVTIGYSSKQPFRVQLHISTGELSEVVVTALGIKREQKALGYAAQTLNSNDVSDARANNWVSALSGKVAGLNLISPGSGPLNSVRVSLRGDASLNPNGNNALIVLDGVPLNSGITSSGVSNAYGAGSGNDVPVDFGNGISDINPDDIESITVLKGAGATALYGSRASNGALLITTKSGVRKDKRIGVTVNSNASFNNVLKWPDYQYQYGQGTGKALNAAGEKYYSYGTSADGASTGGTSSAYGPKFNGQLYYQYDPEIEGQSVEKKLWQPYKDNRKSFWRTGYTISNSISLDGGNENGSARASFTHLKNEWIMPNTGYERINAAISVMQKLSAKLKLQAKINYTNKQSDNLPATGYNNQSIAYFMIFQNPNVDLAWYRPIWKKGLEQVDQVHPFSSFIDNPYLIAYEMTNAVNSQAFTGNVSASYDVNRHVGVMVRSGIDFSSEAREQRRPYSSANFQKGYFKQQDISRYEINTDVLLSYKKKIGSNLQFNASAGANAMVQQYSRVDGFVEGLVIPGVYKLSNGISNPTLLNADANKKLHSVYGLASISYQDKIFVDATGRNDWSSTLPVQNNSFFYPSVNTSIILSQLIHLPAQISYTKLRMSVAQVGNDTEPYYTSKYYGVSEFPSSGSVPTTLHNAHFKPEISTSYEMGLDVRAFQNRLGIDATVYRNFTKNQILEVPLDPTTGYARAVMNAGLVRNQGIELVLNGQLIKNKNVNWSTIVTWSKNNNTVLKLAEGMDGKQDIGYGGNATIQARVGGTTGDIYGFGFMRSPTGEVVYTKDGLPARPSEIQYIGSAYADWRGGVRNEVTYKSFRFSVLVDGQYGGIIYSQTHHKMAEQGKLKSTLQGRDENYIIGDGVVLNAEGKYEKNTKKVLPVDYYADYYRRANVEANSFDASYLKLREVRIEYNIPAKRLKKSAINSISLALYGRDLAMITSFPIYDPETAALNGSTILPGVEMGQMPSTRTIGANITCKF